MSETHKVFNQATPLLDYDMYGDDAVLVDLINRYGASWAEDKLSAFGRFNGSAEGINLAVQANSFLLCSRPTTALVSVSITSTSIRPTIS